MANTRLNEAGRPIGDPNQDLDHIPRALDQQKPPTSEELFIERFEWTPHSKGETTLAVVGLGAELDKPYAPRTSSAVKLLKRAEGYKTESLRGQMTLREALVDHGELDTLDSSLVRGDRKILEILAQHQLFSSSLVHGKMPSLGKGIAKRLNPILIHLYTASDEQLALLWRGAFSSLGARGKFWIDQINSVQGYPSVSMARREMQQRAAQH